MSAEGRRGPRARSMTGRRPPPTGRRVAWRPAASAGVARDGTYRFDRGSPLDLDGPRGGPAGVDGGRAPAGNATPQYGRPGRRAGMSPGDATRERGQRDADFRRTARVT